MFPEYDELLNEIKSMRRDLGWTQKKLAKKAGVSQSLIAKMERENTYPNYRSVRNIYTTLRDEILEEGETAGDLANPNITSVSPDDTKTKAAEIMEENDFSQLPVQKNNEYLGIVLSSDLGLEEDDTEIREVMRNTISTVPHDTPRESVAELLKHKNAVLVKNENGEVHGILTSADLL